MRRAPAARVAACLAAGIFAADRWGESLVEMFAVLALGTLLFGALPAILRVVRQGPRPASSRVQPSKGLMRAWTAALLLFVCGASGYSRLVYRDAAVWRMLLARQQMVELAGRVEQVSRTRRYYVLTLDQPVLLPESLRPSGTIVVFLDRAEVDTDPAPPGARVSVIAQLQSLPLPRNPSDFDYGHYLQRRGVRAIVYPDPDSVFVFSHPPAPLRFTARARKIIRERIRRTVMDPTVQSILTALLLGDRSGIDPDLRYDFAASGLIHLLAVSGLHVMVVGFVFFNISGPLLRRAHLSWATVERVRIPATILLLIGYMVLTGKPASVVRAVIMASAFIVAPLLRRSTNSVNSLFVAAAIILTLAPGSLFEAGFQLSVSAVGAIILLNPILTDSPVAAFAAERIGTATVNNLTVTACATAGVAPVLLTHFGSLSLAGLLLNLPAVPLTAAAMISGVMSSIVGSGLFIGEAYGRASEVCLRLVVELARTGTGHLGRLSVTGYPSASTLVALCAALLALATWRRPQRWAFLGMLVISVSIGRLGHVAHHALDRVDLVFYDVGQGDAALITTASGRSLLVDAGDSRRGRSAAERWILPDLRRRNIKKIDLLLLTHAHSDHIGGVPDLLRTVRVDRIAYNGSRSDSRTMSSIRRIADSLGTPLVRVTMGDSVFLDRSITIHVLWPTTKAIHFLSENDCSVVLHITTAKGRILLTGDIEQRAEREITTMFGRMLKSRVIKVPHHGSSTSSTPALVRNGTRSIRDGIALISVAERNSYRLPDPDVLQRWQEHGFRTVETSRNGGTWFAIDRRGLRLVSWRRDRP